MKSTKSKTQQVKHTQKKSISLMWDKDFVKELLDAAKADDRTLSNYIQVAAKEKLQAMKANA